METNIKNSNEKKSNFIEDSILIKALFVTVIIALLLVPVESVKNVIKERNLRQIEAQNEISSKWGKEQIVSSIILTVPYSIYTKVYTNKEKTEFEIKKENHLAHFLPQELDINGEIKSELKHRGIFNAVVYNSDLKISGSFNQPDFSEWSVGLNEERVIKWHQAFVSLGISDLSAVQEEINLVWNEQKLPFEPINTTMQPYIENSNLSSPVFVNADDTTSNTYNFSFDLKFNGSNSLDFIPLGKTTTVAINSDWKDPKFDGTFLPDTHKVTNKGFDANWKILQINRTLPQKYIDNVRNINSSAFGIKLIVPVDEYLKSMRAVKYAILLISLTFLSFFFIQILRKVQMHPLQYLLIGFALSLFYILLVSISEHLSFDLAYLISAFSTILLVSIYVKKIFKSKNLWLVISSVLSILYVFIFTIIQLQEYSLLMGSIGLFITLAIIMYLSRNIDWYNVGKNNESEI